MPRICLLVNESTCLFGLALFASIELLLRNPNLKLESTLSTANEQKKKNRLLSSWVHCSHRRLFVRDLKPQRKRMIGFHQIVGGSTGPKLSLLNFGWRGK